MTQNDEFTRNELATIRTAWLALERFVDTTNHSDKFALDAAFKMERRDMKGAASSWYVKARVIELWHSGYSAPNAPLSATAYWTRDGLLKAMMLGVRHAVECKQPHHEAPLAELAQAAGDVVNALQTSRQRRRDAI